MESLVKKRCGWCENTFDAYIKYHDEEWGVPVYDDRKHFEFLTLESAQAGLSWATILKKRAGYRVAFANFDVEKVAKYGEKNIEALMSNAGIIRNRLKIAATINNARRFLAIQKEFGSFNTYIRGFIAGKIHMGVWKDIPAKTPESEKLSKDLKNRGFKFVGATTMYAHMQAAGLVNDHTIDCFRYKELIQATH